MSEAQRYTTDIASSGVYIYDSVRQRSIALVLHPTDPGVLADEMIASLNAGQEAARLRRALGTEYGHHNARGSDGPCACGYCRIIDADMAAAALTPAREGA